MLTPPNPPPPPPPPMAWATQSRQFPPENSKKTHTRKAWGRGVVPEVEAVGGGGGRRGCIRREETSEAAPEAVREAVGGGCQSSRGRLLSVTNAIEPGRAVTSRQHSVLVWFARAAQQNTL